MTGMKQNISLMAS